MERGKEGEDRVQRSARRRVATLLLPIGVMVMGSVAAGLSAVPASAAGILPPANPSANVAPDNPDWLTSIDDARSLEGVGSMDVSESALGALPIDQQVLTVVNDERIDRGEPPIDDVTSQLDAYAQGGANAGTDPSFPTTVTGGAPITFGGSIWAGGLTSVLEADYYWMYDDGYSGSADFQLGLQRVEPLRMLGPPRRHPPPVRRLPERSPDPLDGRGLLVLGLRGRLRRRHRRQLVRTPDRHHRQLEPTRQHGPVRFAHGGRRARRPTEQGTGRSRPTARSLPSVRP